ncbi:hypothetical protein ANO11243_075280 [Dothideomycetidae sp. 11243]|nr:hypothetical protein ANO11243_075280 [fungal sp. No.11243]
MRGLVTSGRATNHCLKTQSQGKRTVRAAAVVWGQQMRRALSNNDGGWRRDWPCYGLRTGDNCGLWTSREKVHAALLVRKREACKCHAAAAAATTVRTALANAMIRRCPIDYNSFASDPGID